MEGEVYPMPLISTQFFFKNCIQFYTYFLGIRHCPMGMIITTERTFLWYTIRLTKWGTSVPTIFENRIYNQKFILLSVNLDGNGYLI